jgi:nucleoside 2-deoxyribosyltransferase
MPKTAKQLYVGCSLTQAPEEFKTAVENFKDALRARGYEVFDFVGLVNGTSKDVYNWDIKHCVGDCDALIAICDYPSIGLGYEMNEAIRLKKPVLAIAQADAGVTRLVLGAAEVEDNLRFERYNEMNDALELVDELLAAK